MANEILGVRLDSDSKEILYEKVVSLAKANTDQAKFVVRPNAEIITYAEKNPEFKKVLNKAAVSIPDGIGVYLAAKLLGKKVAGRFGGPESMFELLKLAEEKNLGIYLLGSDAEIVSLASRNIKKSLPNIKILGFHDGFFKNDGAIVAEINSFKPDLIFVGMGFPKQEKWVFDNLEKFQSGVFVMEGGSFDYLSGKVRRAPLVFQKVGLEWLFRLLTQPRRIFRQVRLFKFIFLVVKNKFSKKRA